MGSLFVSPRRLGVEGGCLHGVVRLCYKGRCRKTDRHHMQGARV